MINFNSAMFKLLGLLCGVAGPVGANDAVQFQQNGKCLTSAGFKRGARLAMEPCPTKAATQSEYLPVHSPEVRTDRGPSVPSLIL